MGAQVAKNIILVGFMGTGKTSLAGALAKMTGAPMLDSDAEIEKQTGLTVSEIFAAHGEPFFREQETEFLRKVLGERGRILSTGGGMVMKAENRDMLADGGLVVWLHASEEVIWQRVTRSTKRPLLRTADARSTVRELLQSRESFYKEIAQLELDSGRVSRGRMVQEVLEKAGWLRT